MVKDLRSPFTFSMPAPAALADSFRVHQWQRDPRNPILPPGPAEFDATACMNPFAIRQGDEYFLFYSGGTQAGNRQICLATAPVSAVGNWTRQGAILDLGAAGSFDSVWCVLPCVHRFGDKWHLYYAGWNPHSGAGLQSGGGIGLATSSDLRNWTKFSPEPLLRGDGFSNWPKNNSVGNGGSLIEIPQADGRILYRLYYTLSVGTPSDDLRVDQAKYAATAHSFDGIEWFDKRIVLGPRLNASYEDAATIALNVWQIPSGWRSIYAAIGTRFGAYSLCEATSKDGLLWERGEPEENLTLAPQGDGWESQMVEYPNLIEENGRLRLFYCGNGFGATGIGTALADKIDA